MVTKITYFRYYSLEEMAKYSKCSGLGPDSLCRICSPVTVPFTVLLSFLFTNEVRGIESRICRQRTGTEVIFFSCSTQLSMKSFQLINVKMPTVVGILTLMSWKMASQAYLSLKNAEFLDFFYTYEHLKIPAQLSWA